MNLNYQGPKTLEKPIRTLYQVTSEHLTRDANLEVILGGIERISIQEGKLVVIGDNKVNNRIDTAHRKAIRPNGIISDLESFSALQSLCEESVIPAFSSPEAMAGHNPTMDFIYIPPITVLAFEIFFPMNTQDLLARGNQYLLENHYKALKFPMIFTHELVHWSLAETKFYSDVRKSFLGLEPFYDKKVHGKYPAPTENDSHLFKKPGSEGLGRLQIQESQLRIREFGEAIADLISEKIFPSLPFVELIDYQLSTRNTRIEEIKKRLNSSQSPKELLAYTKHKIDESYEKNKPILELI